MDSKKTDLLQGTLDLLVLKILAPAPLHGYGIAQKILLTSKQILDVQQGSLYPALHRLERKGFVTAEWRESENGRMAKVYSLTKTGRKHLEDQLAEWARYASAINWVGARQKSDGEYGSALGKGLWQRI
jgi:PadR family transcriptional regulator PadR